MNLNSWSNPYAVHVLFCYIPAIVAILGFPVVTLIFAQLDKYSPQLLDTFLLLVLLGFCLTVYFAIAGSSSADHAVDPLMSLSGQLNFVLLMTTAVSFHSDFNVTLMRNTLYATLAALLIYLISPAYFAISGIQFVQGYLGGIIVAWLSYRLMQTRFYYKITEGDARKHLYDELLKLVYPHQLNLIQAGEHLEDTMPVSEARAIVSVFDIQNSSVIRSEPPEFFREIFRALCQVCSEGYEYNPLRARAFRLKEMGDGFISSIGYPFSITAPSLPDHAIETAFKMFKAFEGAVIAAGYKHPLKAAIGLAWNDVQGTFQTSGIRSYDLYGEAVVQADRYESLRQRPVFAQIFQEHARSMGLEIFNLLVIQATIYDGLSHEYQQLFQCIDLEELNEFIPQDPHAKRVYFHISK